MYIFQYKLGRSLVWNWRMRRNGGSTPSTFRNSAPRVHHAGRLCGLVMSRGLLEALLEALEALDALLEALLEALFRCSF
ncbi:hypothetical protein ACN42_g3094 [Penicillium freii]|uniref:Uncharacterized protein n=1 Tax=Penicillium freii TaxID=48697 RepID=A0A124GSC5_PENFR|nr:hypothetical protein ACN42_g3094 [Penicillium freii]